MKRMVKNGDLIDVEADGTITVAGKPLGGGGSDYTAGSNINISETKEISLKNDLTGVNTIAFSDNTACEIGGQYLGKFYIKSKDSSVNIPQIILRPYISGYREITLSFTEDRNQDNVVVTDTRGSGSETLYTFLTKKSKVPFVPSADGTYVLKATVSGNNVTYEWVAQ